MSVPRFNHELLPELKAWNGDAGVTALDWLYTFAQSDVTTAYALLFWPEFIVLEGYVFRSDFSEEILRGWEQQDGITRSQIEASANYLSVSDLFSNASEEESPLLERRIDFLGRVLAQTYEAKLAKDFPDRHFTVSLFDDEDELTLTFFQT